MESLVGEEGEVSAAADLSSTAGEVDIDTYISELSIIRRLCHYHVLHWNAHFGLVPELGSRYTCIQSKETIYDPALLLTLLRWKKFSKFSTRRDRLFSAPSDVASAV